jgi:putative (di)nucleoside polyphosphate hydrolase
MGTLYADPMEDAAPAIDLSFYRPNVGVVLFDGRGRVWLGRRSKTSGPFNWQFPQGGVDDGEDLYAAALRELQEETGITSVSLLGRTDDWVTYDFPAGWTGSKAMKGWRGQKQVWFAFRFEGDEAEINLDAHLPAEFDDWRWDRLEEAPAKVAPFKRETYDHVVDAFRHYAAPAGGQPRRGWWARLLGA